MTNEEKNKLVQKESRCLWRCRAFKLFVLCIVVFCVVMIVQKIRFRVRQIGCAIQLKCLGTSLLAYMNDFEENLPTANAWNELIIEYDLTPSAFHCPGSKSAGKTSDYAINSNLYENETSASGDSVLLFDCNPDWNQVGGSEVFTSSNHNSKGGNYNTLGNPEGRFIKSEEIESLNWEP